MGEKEVRLVSAMYSDFYPFDIYLADIITGCEVVIYPSDLREGDILIVHGGADISPAMYKQQRSKHGGGNHEITGRDKIEWDLMQKAKELKIPIIGICRGAQMLCALEGGYLIQHVNNHSGTHEIETFDGKSLMVNSIHHQMMAPTTASNWELVAWTSKRSDQYWHTAEGEDQCAQEHPVLGNKDPEFIYYPDIKGFAIQWHPEVMQIGPTNNYVNSFIKERL